MLNMPDPIPQQVKAEVRKELARKDLSWMRKDYLVVGVLFLILTVLSTVQIAGLQKATLAAEKAEKAAGIGRLLEECRTPGTECFEYTKARDLADQQYQNKLTKTANICTLLTSGRVSDGVIANTAPAIEADYEQCVNARVSSSPPEPSTGQSQNQSGR